jgi:dipeptidyl aminopeptidase/acylaminoacyl peptidase
MAGMLLRRVPAPVVVAAVLAVSACSSSAPAERAAPSTAAPSTAAPSTAASSTAVPSTAAPPAAALPPVTDPVSLPALMRRTYDGRGLRVGRILNRTDRYIRHFVTYRSGDLRISGILNIPRRTGPHPVVVLLHGHIDTTIYVNGQGMLREQDYLARRGFAVLHVDYRNHAQSDDDPTAERQLRLGYTEDAINAVLAVRRSALPSLDGTRVALFGRSMGGGVVLNALVAAPGLVRAAVAYAPVSSTTADNFNRWIRDAPGRNALSDRILARYGAPEDNPAYWRTVSSITYFDRVSDPLLVQHGTADESCPIRWTRRTVGALRRDGKDVTLFTYPGEGHNFAAAWPRSMRRTVAFLRASLDA